jgi:hypothetical protein
LPNKLHPKFNWPSQWRFQISAQIHPKFELASQSVVIKKAHPKLCGPNTYYSYGNKKARTCTMTGMQPRLTATFMWWASSVEGIVG